MTSISSITINGITVQLLAAGGSRFHQLIHRSPKLSKQFYITPVLGADPVLWSRWRRDYPANQQVRHLDQSWAAGETHTVPMDGLRPAVMTYRITKSCLFLRSRITSLPLFSTFVLYTHDVNGDPSTTITGAISLSASVSNIPVLRLHLLLSTSTSIGTVNSSESQQYLTNVGGDYRDLPRRRRSGLAGNRRSKDDSRHLDTETVLVENAFVWRQNGRPINDRRQSAWSVSD